MSMTLSPSKKVAYTAILTCLALIFSYIEAMLPFAIPIPGVKLGIANLIIIIALYILDTKYAFLINIMRILFAGLLFSGVFGIIYSLAGGILSLLVMAILKKTKLFSIVGISVAGGVTHNLGQLITAGLIVENFNVFYYFPILLFSGIVCGVIIGIIAYLVLSRSSAQLKSRIKF